MAIDTLQDMQTRLTCQVHAYCLMPDHLHFLISPKEDGISVLKFTDQYKGKTTHLGWALGWKGKLWQPRYYDHIVRSDESLISISEYILQNPIRKQLVSSVDDWPWCGINP
jgi:putative transposase